MPRERGVAIRFGASSRVATCGPERCGPVIARATARGRARRPRPLNQGQAGQEAAENVVAHGQGSRSQPVRAQKVAAIGVRRPASSGDGALEIVRVPGGPREDGA